jgi:hypothetical protein
MGDRISRMYRGHRIVVFRLGGTWHAVVHDPDGAIVERDIEGKTIRNAIARAEWAVETKLAFRPPRSGQRRVG